MRHKEEKAMKTKFHMINRHNMTLWLSLLKQHSFLIIIIKIKN